MLVRFKFILKCVALQIERRGVRPKAFSIAIIRNNVSKAALIHVGFFLKNDKLKQ